jgi:hypothetical protein
MASTLLFIGRVSVNISKRVYVGKSQRLTFGITVKRSIKNAYGGQLNRFTHLRALLVLHDRGNFGARQLAPLMVGSVRRWDDLRGPRSRVFVDLHYTMLPTVPRRGAPLRAGGLPSTLSPPPLGRRPALPIRSPTLPFAFPYQPLLYPSPVLPPARTNRLENIWQRSGNIWHRSENIWHRSGNIRQTSREHLLTSAAFPFTLCCVSGALAFSAAPILTQTEDVRIAKPEHVVVNLDNWKETGTVGT